jgi:N-acylneuraminate cytidylyltransferase
LAQKSGRFDTTMVSTDDSEIADIAKIYGADVPFMRSTVSADDSATLLDAITDVYIEYKKRGVQCDAICCILPTAVMARLQDLDQCYKAFVSGSYDSVFPVSRFPYPIQRALIIDKHGFVAMERPEYYRSRSQDLEPAYHDAGQFYWLNPEVCIQKKSIITNHSKCIVLPEYLVQDIDIEDDLIMAEAKIQIAMNRKWIQS